MCTSEKMQFYLEQKKNLSPIELAELVCIEQHKNVKRKYSGEPYHTHPFAVRNIISIIPHIKEADLQAALLHDVVEDTDMTLDEIKILFGNEVCTLVEGLTNISKSSDGNRATRKAIDRAHTAKSCSRTKTIKLADILHNASSIKKHDLDFWKTYSKEKKLLLPFLKEGNTILYQQLQNILK